jgi:hypothetical protein
VDPKKIKAIKSWLAPNNVAKVRSFMGLDGHYRIFIEGFANVAHLITSLQKKGINFEWNVKCEASFPHFM